MCGKIKSHPTTTKIQNQKFSKLHHKKIAQRQSLKPKANKNFKVLLGQIINTIATVEFLVCVSSNSTITLP